MPTEYTASALRAKWDADRARLATQEGPDDVPALGKQEFEDALCANPDDREVYLVYADWLSEHGDDWGQLITVQHAIESLPRFGSGARRDELTRTEALLLFRLSARLWGSLGSTVYDEQTQRYYCDLIIAEWRCGFVRTARIRPVEDDVFRVLVRGLAAAPVALVLRELTVGQRPWEDDTLETVTAQAWPCLEALTIDGPFAPERISPILARAPRLARIIAYHTRIDVRGATEEQLRDKLWELSREQTDDDDDDE